MKLIQIYDKMDRHGGAQSVLMNLDEYFQSKITTTYVSGSVSYEKFYFKSQVPESRYIQFSIKNIFLFKGATIVSHSRKITTYLIVLNKLLNLKMKIVHIAHNIFNNKKHTTLYPKNIIAVSQSVKKNLIDYFEVKESNVEVIYNGISDENTTLETVEYDTENIKIVLIGRIENVKQQVKLVQELVGKIHKNITIDFTGDGSQAEILKSFIKQNENTNFNYIGFSNKITELIKNYNYVLLFSEKEGLGLSLIEGCMIGKALISRGNDGCEACAEVCINGYNGYIVNTFEELIDLLNKLDKVSEKDYKKMCVNSRKHYETYFQREMMLNKYLAYIVKV